MKWISVKDRLPEIGETVLTCNDERHIQSARYYEPSELAFKGCWTTPYQDLEDVTHWAPMPEVPEFETEIDGSNKLTLSDLESWPFEAQQKLDSLNDRLEENINALELGALRRIVKRGGKTSFMYSQAQQLVAVRVCALLDKYDEEVCTMINKFGKNSG